MGRLEQIMIADRQAEFSPRFKRDLLRVASALGSFAIETAVVNEVAPGGLVTTALYAVGIGVSIGLAAKPFLRHFNASLGRTDGYVYWFGRQNSNTTQ